MGMVQTAHSPDVLAPPDKHTGFRYAVALGSVAVVSALTAVGIMKVTASDDAQPRTDKRVSVQHKHDKTTTKPSLPAEGFVRGETTPVQEVVSDDAQTTLNMLLSNLGNIYNSGNPEKAKPYLKHYLAKPTGPTAEEFLDESVSGTIWHTEYTGSVIDYDFSDSTRRIITYQYTERLFQLNGIEDSSSPQTATAKMTLIPIGSEWLVESDVPLTDEVPA